MQNNFLQLKFCVTHCELYECLSNRNTGTKSHILLYTLQTYNSANVWEKSHEWTNALCLQKFKMVQMCVKVFEELAVSYSMFVVNLF